MEGYNWTHEARTAMTSKNEDENSCFDEVNDGDEGERLRLKESGQGKAYQVLTSKGVFRTGLAYSPRAVLFRWQGVPRSVDAK